MFNKVYGYYAVWYLLLGVTSQEVFQSYCPFCDTQKTS